MPDVDGRNHFGVGNYSNGLVTSLPLVPLSRLYGDAVLIFIKMVPIWIIQLLAPNQNFPFSQSLSKTNEKSTTKIARILNPEYDSVIDLF